MLDRAAELAINGLFTVVGILIAFVIAGYLMESLADDSQDDSPEN